MENLKEKIRKLRAGQWFNYTGVLYTARDQAHRKILEALRGGRKIPFDLKGQVIYYCGPTKTPKGKIIGSCGPTTSSRMDKFTPQLLKAGLFGVIGKGDRSIEVIRAIKKYKRVYFVTYAGCGALLSKYVVKSEIIGYRELGPEAIRRLWVRDFPLIVAIDSRGKNIYSKRSNP